MTNPNGNGMNTSQVLEPAPVEEMSGSSSSGSQSLPLTELATRASRKAWQQGQPNRFIIVAAGTVVTALLIFVAVSMPRHGTANKTPVHRPSAGDFAKGDVSETGNDKSLLPITDSGRPSPHQGHNGFLNERDLERTANRATSRAQAPQPNAAGTLGSIASFGEQNWQAPPYQAGSSPSTDFDKAEREAMEKSSLVYIGKSSASTSGRGQSGDHEESESQFGLGLATGTRLRARMESAASSAVRIPVLAVIEYNYEKDGEIIIPAGAKAIGHIRDANRSGYVDIQFDSLVMPDGSSIPIEAAAIGLDLKPLKGKVEGKNTGKNIIVRSLSGIGQAGSMILGQNSLNQPLNESDLIRERASSNIGEAGDEEVSRLAVNQHIVVTVPAGVPVYVVIEQLSKAGRSTPTRTAPSEASISRDQLHQLLQLEQELRQSQDGKPANPN